MTSPLRRRRAVIAAGMSAVALASITACAPPDHSRPETSVSPASPDGVVTAAVAYIAAHPAPPRAGMESGILISSDMAGTIPPGAWRWWGTVVEAGGRVAEIGAAAGPYDCPPPQPPAPEPGDLGLLNAYIYFPADSSHLCPPDGVIIIRRSAVGPGGPGGWIAA